MNTFGLFIVFYFVLIHILMQSSFLYSHSDSRKSSSCPMRKKAFIAPPPPHENCDFHSHMLFNYLSALVLIKVSLKHTSWPNTVVFTGVCVAYVSGVWIWFAAVWMWWSLDIIWDLYVISTCGTLIYIHHDEHITPDCHGKYSQRGRLHNLAPERLTPSHLQLQNHFSQSGLYFHVLLYTPAKAAVTCDGNGVDAWMWKSVIEKLKSGRRSWPHEAR